MPYLLSPLFSTPTSIVLPCYLTLSSLLWVPANLPSSSSSRVSFLRVPFIFRNDQSLPLPAAGLTNASSGAREGKSPSYPQIGGGGVRSGFGFRTSLSLSMNQMLLSGVRAWLLRETSLRVCLFRTPLPTPFILRRIFSYSLE